MGQITTWERNAFFIDEKKDVYLYYSVSFEKKKKNSLWGFKTSIYTMTQKYIVQKTFECGVESFVHRKIFFFWKKKTI